MARAAERFVFLGFLRLCRSDGMFPLISGGSRDPPGRSPMGAQVRANKHHRALRLMDPPPKTRVGAACVPTGVAAQTRRTGFFDRRRDLPPRPSIPIECF